MLSVFVTRKRVAVTATTGLAATQLAPLKAITIHRYAGQLDGRFSNEELSDMLSHNDDRRDTHDSVLNTDVIVIDEVSMLSQRTLEQLNFVFQKIHKNNKQTILAGDFFKLPPIPNHDYGDKGNYCFQSSIFKLIVPHHVNLAEVHRQDNCRLIQAIQEVSRGISSEDTLDLIVELGRPVTGTLNSPTQRLFHLTTDMELYNAQALFRFPGR